MKTNCCRVHRKFKIFSIASGCWNFRFRVLLRWRQSKGLTLYIHRLSVHVYVYSVQTLLCLERACVQEQEAFSRSGWSGLLINNCNLQRGWSLSNAIVCKLSETLGCQRSKWPNSQHNSITHSAQLNIFCLIQLIADERDWNLISNPDD
jgi:hypothetical protein